MTLLEFFNQAFGLGTILLEVGVVIGILLLISVRTGSPLMEKVSDLAIPVAFFLTLGATLGSLFYSLIAQFPPCDLCWYQRIFMYPLLILLGIGWWKKDRRVVDYVLGLTIPGTLIALYHSYIYYGGYSLLPCAASGLGVSCTKRYVFEFGYVTIPLMSLTIFAAVLVLMVIAKRHSKTN